MTQLGAVTLPDDPPVVELNLWALVLGPKGTVCLRGLCHGHPKHEDGKLITTSTVRGKRAGMLLTRHTLYLLREPHAAYVLAYPGACREMVINEMQVPVV